MERVSPGMEILGSLGKITADLLAGVTRRRQPKARAEQLASEIVEYGRMNVTGSGEILIEVYDVAFRLRESPRDVRQALCLLQVKGIALRTSSKDCWKLRC
jgi:hypothetical protein